VAALIGWCPFPKPPPPPPPPWKLIHRIIAGLLGGIAGAYLVYWGLDLSSPLDSVDFIAVMIGAFAVGQVFQEVAIWIFSGRERI
jgi:tetrahydromethanopterin S-methyltransferase subunit D